MDLCDLLAQHGWLTAEQADRIRRTAATSQVGELLRTGVVSPAAMVDALAQHTGLRTLDAMDLKPSSQVVSLLPWDLAFKTLILPLRTEVAGDGCRLHMAVADPLDQTNLDEVADLTGCRLVLALADAELLKAAIERTYSSVVTRVIARPIDQQPVPSSHQDNSPHHNGPSTVPSHRVVDDVDPAMQIRALVNLLERSGIITSEEYLDELHHLMEQGES
ncbi:MAG: hypothetical protein J7M25_10020 [Deltaproteobacteria bacterium]|nr:hypothetical protein [Deltaproteobacteria bacterium]